MNIQRVNYKADGIDVVANVYTPAGYTESGRYAAVVVAHPNGGSKDQVAGLYARHLAEAGFVTIAFLPDPVRCSKLSTSWSWR